MSLALLTDCSVRLSIFISTVAGRRFLMVAGGKGQHFGKHIFADFADGHHGDPSHQIGAGKAADATDDDEDDEEERTVQILFSVPKPYR